jgi:hypothetical protein
VAVEVTVLPTKQVILVDLAAAVELEAVAQEAEILLALVLHKVIPVVTLQLIELEEAVDLAVPVESVVDLQVLQILMDHLQIELAAVAAVAALADLVLQEAVVELRQEHPQEDLQELVMLQLIREVEPVVAECLIEMELVVVRV